MVLKKFWVNCPARSKCWLTSSPVTNVLPSWHRRNMHSYHDIINMFCKLGEPAMPRNTNQSMARQLGPKERRTDLWVWVWV